MSDNPILTPDDVLQALRVWYENETEHWPLAHLRLNAELTPEELGAHSGLAGNELANRNRAILGRGMALLEQMSPKGFEILRERFVHEKLSLALAHSMNIAHSTLQYHQKKAIEKLTEIILDLEKGLSTQWQERMLARLDVPTYRQLIGVSAPHHRLVEVLTTAPAGGITAIDGIGGIGKTALADRVVRDLVAAAAFDDIAWITAKQTHLSAMGRLQVETGRPALTPAMLLDALADQFGIETDDGLRVSRQEPTRRYLKDSRCLVIVDNLETVADYRMLLPELRRWGGSSQFLLTSRRRLLDEPGIYSVSLQELAVPDAFMLIRAEAERIGFADLAGADDEILQQIVATIGGNPLALKLVVAQLRLYSLEQVLAWFTGSEARGGGALFDYIYREIWEALSDQNKQTLLALTWTDGHSPNLAHLVEVSGLSQAAVMESLTELIALSLVEPAGTLSERRYRLHRLTISYLARRFDQHGRN